MSANSTGSKVHIANCGSVVTIINDANLQVYCTEEAEQRGRRGNRPLNNCPTCIVS